MCGDLINVHEYNKSFQLNALLFKNVGLVKF